MNPPHPGEFIREIYITPFKLSSEKVADSLGMPPSTFNRLLNGESDVSPEMALRLSKSLGRSPESWLTMQDQYDLWHARKKINLEQVKKAEFIRHITTVRGDGIQSDHPTCVSGVIPSDTSHNHNVKTLTLVLRRFPEKNIPSQYL